MKLFQEELSDEIKIKTFYFKASWLAYNYYTSTSILFFDSDAFCILLYTN